MRVFSSPCYVQVAYLSEDLHYISKYKQFFLRIYDARKIVNLLIFINFLFFAVPSRRVSLVTSVPTSIPSANSVCPARSWAVCSRIPPSSASIIRFARNRRVRIPIRSLPFRRWKRRANAQNLPGDDEIERIWVDVQIWMSFWSEVLIHKKLLYIGQWWDVQA